MTTLPSVDFAPLAQIPDATLDELLDAIRDGAQTPAEAMGFGPAAINAIERMALSQYRARRYGEAAVLYGFILRMAPRASAWRGLGACSHALKNYENAARCYQYAVEGDPADLPAKVFWGEALCQLGQREQGLKILGEVVAAGPKVAAHAAYVTRARAIVGAKGGLPPRIVLMRQGKRILDEAEQALANEAELDPNRPLEADDMLKNPKLKPLLHDLAAAVQDGRLSLAQVGGFSKKELEGAYVVGCRYLEIGQALQAMQIAGFLMFLEPHDARFPQLLGICLQRMKQYEIAEKFYGFALAIDGNAAMTLVYQGECKIMRGDIDGGLGVVREGIKAAGKSKEQRQIAARGEALLQQFARK